MKQLKRVSLASILGCGLIAALPVRAQVPPPAPAKVCEPPGEGKPFSIRQRLVVSGPEHTALLQGDGVKTGFSLRRTLGAIVETAAAKGDQNASITAAEKEARSVAMLKSLLDTFGPTQPQMTNPVSGFEKKLSPRPEEAKLKAEELLKVGGPDEMLPIALFNRLDLAPAGKRYCGEHRIVYAKRQGGGAPGRLFLIFEAALDNPSSTDAEEGCRRVARFWDKAGTLTGQALASALEGFYYAGDLGDGGSNPLAVVKHRHYGVPFGQVRGNLFLNGPQVPWNLREWRTSFSPNGMPIFIAETVKSNPHAALYAASAGDGLAKLRQHFQDEFIVSTVRELIEPELARVRDPALPPLTPTELFARISARFGPGFDAFESFSQTPGGQQAEDPNATASPELRERIGKELKLYKLPEANPLTAEHILARAGALSCAGCHKLSNQNAKPLAPGDQFKWPEDLFFVHVDEQGALSRALHEHFLPMRCLNMEDAVKVKAPSPTAQVPLEAVLLNTRDSLFSAQRASNAAQRIERLKGLEEFVKAARSQDAATQGAFIPFRRSH